MFRLIFVMLLVLVLGGCATGAKKQTSQPLSSSYEKPSRTYQQETTWDYDYEPIEAPKKEVKKAYVEPTQVQLSPKQIQRALKNAGFHQGPIDGKIGPKTKEAIIKFQKAKGLKADGIVGKRTSAELNKYLSR